MQVDAVGPEIQLRGRGSGRVGDTPVTDERHSVIIDIGHARLQEAHLVREILEPVGDEYVVGDIDERCRIPVRKEVLIGTGMCHGHGGTG